MITFDQLLNKYRAISFSERDKGWLEIKELISEMIYERA